MKWSDMAKLISQWLPQPRIQHPWPNQRSPSNTQGGSRMREGRTYGFMRGAHSDMRPYRDPYLPYIRLFRPLIFQSVTSSGGHSVLFQSSNHLGSSSSSLDPDMGARCLA